jgi:photosystem II stability/assembly factor-like uncharacterized protein
VNSGLPVSSTLHGSGGVYALAVDPRDPATLYGSLCSTEVNNADSTRLFKSTDGGANWKQLGSGLPDQVYFRALAIDPRNSSTVYAGGDAGVFRSLDGGETWSATNSGMAESFVYSLVIDPQDHRTLYAGTGAGLYVITFVP